MIVSAQVAIYPLRQERLTPAITEVSHAFEAAGLVQAGAVVESPRPTAACWSRRSRRWPKRQSGGAAPSGSPRAMGQTRPSVAPLPPWPVMPDGRTRPIHCSLLWQPSCSIPSGSG